MTSLWSRRHLHESPEQTQTLTLCVSTACATVNSKHPPVTTETVNVHVVGHHVVPASSGKLLEMDHPGHKVTAPGTLHITAPFAPFRTGDKPAAQRIIPSDGLSTGLSLPWTISTRIGCKSNFFSKVQTWNFLMLITDALFKY